MTNFPGFPTNNFDFHFEEVGPALAGLIVRDVNGNPRAGILPSRADLIRGRADWFVDVSPFVAVRAKGRAVLIGGTDEAQSVAVAPAPSANSRIDVFYTRPADMDANEPITPVLVAQGNAAAVPSKPAIPLGAIELGTLRLAAGATGTGSGTLANTFAQTCCAGGTLVFRSTTERNSFAALPDQKCIIDGTEYIRRGSSWIELQKAAGGEASINLQPNNGSSQLVINLPSGLFKNPPAITLGSRSPLSTTEVTSYRLLGRSADAFTVEARRPGLTQVTAFPITWTAVGS